MKRNKKKKILLFPPHTKEVNRASIGDKSHPLRYLLSLFLFGTGRSLARKFFGWKRADPYIQAKYIKRTARERERGGALYGGGERQTWKEEENGGGLFSSVSDFSLSTSS
jgi:hypothetical protein